MNSEQVLVSKELINFAISHVIKSYMLENKMGTYCSVLKAYEFSDRDFEELNKLIKSNDLSIGYYDLCDLIGRDYV